MLLALLAQVGSPPEYVWQLRALDACNGKGTLNQTRTQLYCAPVSTLGVVRCCKRRQCVSVCEAQMPSLTNISGTADTYARAEMECAARNMKLCTQAELAGTCCHSGCHFDREFVWSNEVCSRKQCMSPQSRVLQGKGSCSDQQVPVLSVLDVRAPAVSTRGAASPWDGSSLLSDPREKECAWRHVAATPDARSYAMCLRPYHDIISSAIRASGTWKECHVLWHVWRMMHAEHIQRSVFVDAGANIGSCSLYMAARNVTTVSFEPSLANLHYLTRTLASPQNRAVSAKVTLFPVGLSDVDGRVQVKAAKGNAGDTTLHPTQGGQLSNTSRPNEARIIRLDQVRWPRRAPRLSLMKMDVQGFETKLLLGAAVLLNAGAIGCLVFEVSPRHLKSAGTTLKKLFRVVSKHFTIYQLPRLHPYAPLVKVAQAGLPNHEADYLACRGASERDPISFPYVVD